MVDVVNNKEQDKQFTVSSNEPMSEKGMSSSDKEALDNLLDDFLGVTKEESNQNKISSSDNIVTNLGAGVLNQLWATSLKRTAVFNSFMNVVNTVSISIENCKKSALAKDALVATSLDLIENDKQFIKKIIYRLSKSLDNVDSKEFSAKNIRHDIALLLQTGFLTPIINNDVVLFLQTANIESFSGKVVYDRNEEVTSVNLDANFYVEDDNGTRYKLTTTNQTIFYGDEVSCILDKSRAALYLQSIITPHNLVLGRVLDSKHGYYLAPDDEHFNCRSFYFTDKSQAIVKLGSIYVCSVVARSNDGVFQVEVLEELGESSRLDNSIKIAISRHDIPCEWNKGVENQISKFADVVLEEDKLDRVDLRDLPLVTIDGADARDFDDAVYCKKEGAKFRLYVAIADVSYYVKYGSPLDQEALRRGNSVYFPNYVVPMLPEKLSNGLCSLNPNEDRLCMVCEMVISKAGVIGEYKFYPALMNSHARLTYTEVGDFLEGKVDINSKVADLQADIKNLYAVYQALKHARTVRGGIEFESKEVRFIFNENLQIEDIVPIERNEAHMLIEECMIAANVCAAKFVEENEGETLFRVHDKPSDEKVAEFKSFITPLGYSLGSKSPVTSKDYAKLANDVKGNPSEDVVYLMMLRSMSLAQYSPTNIGHFGLALGDYAHFTSPIRRYADLQLHREIKYLLGLSKAQPPTTMKKFGAYAYHKEELEYIADMANEGERRANTVTREVDAVLKAKFMERYINKVLKGRIINVISHGLFVSIDQFGVIGFVYVGSLGGDYFVFSNNALVGEYSGLTYCIGAEVYVKVVDIDPIESKVNLAIVNTDNAEDKVETMNKYIATGSKKITNLEANTRVREFLDKVHESEQQSSKDLIFTSRNKIINEARIGKERRYSEPKKKKLKKKVKGKAK